MIWSDTETEKYREIKPFGGSSHVILPRECIGRLAKIFVDKWPAGKSCRNCVFYDPIWSGCVRDRKLEPIPLEAKCRYLMTLEDVRGLAKVEEE